MLFCKINLRIYNNLKEYLVDRDSLFSKSAILANDIIKLTGLAISSVMTDNFLDEDGDEQTPDNIPPIIYDEKAPFLS